VSNKPLWLTAVASIGLVVALVTVLDNKKSTVEKYDEGFEDKCNKKGGIVMYDNRRSTSIPHCISQKVVIPITTE